MVAAIASNLNLETTPSTAIVYDSVFDGVDTWVAVGAGGLIWTSDRQTKVWTARTSGVATDLKGSVWDGAQFVVVGSGGVVLTSPTGVTWNAETSGTGNALEDIAHNGSLLVAVGGSGTVITSPDGAAWTTRTSGTSDDLTACATDLTSFVTVGDLGTVITSPTGVTWSPGVSGLGPVTITDVEYGAGVWLFVITSSIYISEDAGATWALAYTPGGAAPSIHCILWTGDFFACPGNPMTHPIMTTSRDGVDFRDTSITYDYAKNAASFGAGVILFVGDNGEIHSSLRS
ncbi:MAG: hypothetical protein JRD89_01410 [Deltaproteobacteria bacterium]|nr:hypothetical protein [Deltaproteobacteria bacterium]